MALVLQSPEDVCNAAISRLGYKRFIGSLYDGSEPAKMFLRIYGQTRDALLRSRDWGFAEGFVAGSIDGVAPFPWNYQYAFPTDALKIRAVFSQASYTADLNNPTPVDWRVGNATVSSRNQQVVWCNIAAATLVYTRQVTLPTAWEPLFAESLIAGLSRRAAIGLAGMDAMKAFSEDEMTTTKEADGVQG